MSTPPLAALLDAYRGYADADPVSSAVFAREAALMRSPDRLARRLRTGDPVPDLPLPDAPDGPPRLSDLWRDGPLVLKFYRGRWCPYCTLDLRAWQRALPELRARGTRLVAITPQEAPEIALTRERDRLGFRIVSDPGNRIARAFGIAYEVDPEVRALYEGFGLSGSQVDPAGTWTLPLPACYLIGTDGRVEWAHVDVDYRRRAEPADLVARLDRAACGRLPADG